MPAMLAEASDYAHDYENYTHYVNALQCAKSEIRKHIVLQTNFSWNPKPIVHLLLS